MNARLTTAGGRVSVPTHREVSDATVNPDMRKMTYTSALISTNVKLPITLVTLSKTVIVST